jgi:hypothetical protein
MTDDGLATLTRLRRLNDLLVALPQVTTKGLAHVGKASTVSTLRVRPGIDDAGIAELRGLKLKSADLDGKGITDAGMKHVAAQWPDLFDLSFVETSVGDQGLATLRGMKLARFTFHEAPNLTSAGLKTIAEFPFLTHVGLGNGAFTDDALPVLRKATHLRQIGLNHSRYADDTLVHLKGWDALRTLYLHGSSVSDAGLEHLHELKGLVYISLQGTRVSDKGVARLAAALPHCAIISDHGTFGASLSPAPSGRDKPFTLVRAGKEAGAFKQLAGALANLRDGDVVEIHGNGPFTVGAVKVEGQGLRMRAGPGYRPRLEMSEALADEPAWFIVRGGPMTIEGCDFVGAKQCHFFRHAGGLLHLRGCRFLQCTGVAIYETGPGVLLDSCLLHAHYGLTVGANDTSVEVRNCIGITEVYFATVRGGTKVRLQSNTVQLTGRLVHIDPPDPANRRRFIWRTTTLAATSLATRPHWWESWPRNGGRT